MNRRPPAAPTEGKLELPSIANHLAPIIDGLQSVEARATAGSPDSGMIREGAATARRQLLNLANEKLLLVPLPDPEPRAILSESFNLSRNRQMVIGLLLNQGERLVQTCQPESLTRESAVGMRKCVEETQALLRETRKSGNFTTMENYIATNRGQMISYPTDVPKVAAPVQATTAKPQETAAKPQEKPQEKTIPFTEAWQLVRTQWEESKSGYLGKLREVKQTAEALFHDPTSNLKGDYIRGEMEGNRDWERAQQTIRAFRALSEQAARVTITPLRGTLVTNKGKMFTATPGEVLSPAPQLPAGSALDERQERILGECARFYNRVASIMNVDPDHRRSTKLGHMEANLTFFEGLALADPEVAKIPVSVKAMEVALQTRGSARSDVVSDPRTGGDSHGGPAHRTQQHKQSR